MPPVAVENIPKCLTEIPQWLCWRQEERGGKPRKVPYDPKTGRLASSTDSRTWSSFEQALGAFESGGHDGIGFVFTTDDPFCGVDLDDCLDNDGRLAEWAREVVDHFETYTEISPSGRGVKLFLRGRKPPTARCAARDLGPERTGRLEIFDQGRYFTLTGRLWDGSPATVEHRQGQLQEICEFLWPTAPAKPAAPMSPPAADRRIAACLEAMLAMNVADHFDGSFRLFAACCRCVEHDLTDEQAVSCIRTYAAQRPFPKDWGDRHILRRLRDAEKKCVRARRSRAVWAYHRPTASTIIGLGRPLSSRPTNTVSSARRWRR